MGLDMYLYIRKSEYRSAYSEEGVTYPKELSKFQTAISNRNFASAETKTDYQVAYWRKCNAVHKYFVENCANGVDDCNPIVISLEKLEELKHLVSIVLENPSKAGELLPTCRGFFFGSDKHDEWFWEDMRYTKTALEEVIKFLKQKAKEVGKDFRKPTYEAVYCASW